MSIINSQPSGGVSSQQQMLMFKLWEGHTYGINVLKIREVIPYQPLDRVPGSHPTVIGLANLRGSKLPVIDLSAAIGLSSPGDEDLSQSSIIISEFNRSLQGFLVSKVDRIISIGWDAIKAVPKSAGRFNYITGVVKLEDMLMEVLDVERVLNEVAPPTDSTGHGVSLNEEQLQTLSEKLVLVVDDSNMAQNQTSSTLGMIGIDNLSAGDGVEALEMMESLYREGRLVDMVISDIEMPRMDGYTLTRKIRNNPDFSDTYVLLHSSLAGAVSEENATASGADAMLTKFVTEELAQAVLKGLLKTR
ncbi:MAG: chemotaxis protein [Sedimenticola sp.]